MAAGSTLAEEKTDDLKPKMKPKNTKIDKISKKIKIFRRFKQRIFHTVKRMLTITTINNNATNANNGAC